MAETDPVPTWVGGQEWPHMANEEFVDRDGEEGKGTSASGIPDTSVAEY